MSKIKCFNCGEFGHFARDCPKARDNANIAQETEQSRKSESMLDLDSISVREECAMVCTELQYEDASESEIVYGDQGIPAEEYENATYRDLMKTQSENEEEQLPNELTIVCYWKGRGDNLMKRIPTRNKTMINSVTHK